VLVITGAVNPRSEKAVKNLFDQIPDPKAVVVVGSCGSTGGVFHDCYNIRGGVDMALPVDVYVPGCPARPEAIIDGVVKALGIVKTKLEGTYKAEKPEPLVLLPVAAPVSPAKAAETTGDAAAPATGGEGR
jgi:ech hydrogenase subunit C